MNRNDLQRWLKSIVVTLVVFLIVSIYLYVRQGNYDVNVINKVFGSTAVILAGITLLLGPLRKNPIVSFLMTIRRHLGLTAFGFALFHVAFSLYQTNRFAWFSWYINEWIPVGFGIFAIATWGYMSYISRNKKIQEMGVSTWKNRLSIGGKLAFLAIFLHVTILKYQGWIRWWNGGGYPPSSVFVFIFMLIVIGYRIYISLRHSAPKAAK